MKALNAQEARLHPRELSFCLLLGLDFLMVIAAQVTGFLLRFGVPWPETLLATKAHGVEDYLGHFIFGTLLFFLVTAWQSVYRNEQFLHTRSSIFLLLRAVALWAIFYLLITLFIRFEPAISRLYVFGSSLLMMLFLLCGRKLVQELFRGSGWLEGLQQRVVFMGWSPQAERLISSMRKDRYHPYRLLGCVKLPNQIAAAPSDLEILGTMKELGQLKKDHGIDLAVLADTSATPEEISRWCELCSRERIVFKVIPDYFEILLSGLKLESISGVPVLGLEPLPVELLHQRLIKRILDLIGSVLGLLLGMPLIVLGVLLVYRESPGPLFYSQIRSGRKGKEFRMWKLRTMKQDAEKGGAGWTTVDDPRVLNCGRWMRRWNIDEIPQFWNVLKGEMSLVGPRPERPEHIETLKYRVRYYNVRHSIKPGMTGWAQVNGLRGDTSISDRVQYDLYYAENWSVWLDLYIMAVTLFRRKNAY
jgi:exopolysaccharide biosynthesis polyprenyl glycosylphosphotransferase